MPLIAPPGGSSEPHPAGGFPAICIDVVDKGLQQSTWEGKEVTRHRFFFRFYCGQTRADGSIAWVNRGLTLTTHEKGTVWSFLGAWMGRSFSEGDRRTFDMEQMIGEPAYLQVLHKDGRAQINSIMPLPTGMPVPNMPDYTRVANGGGQQPTGDDIPF